MKKAPKQTATITRIMRLLNRIFREAFISPSNKDFRRLKDFISS